MAGAIIENMSGRKLMMIGTVALICQIVCFLVGALFAPTPTSSDQYTATKCYNKAGSKVKDTWFWPRGKGACRQIEDFSSDESLKMHMNADNVVFSFQMPLPKNNDHLDFTRWQQNLLGVLMADIMYQEDELMAPRVDFMLHAGLAYRNKGDPEDQWKELAHSFEFRSLDCSIEDENRVDGYHYNCDIMPLFELGSLHHDFYLLNLRIPTVYLDENNQVHEINQQIGKLVDLHLAGIHANGGFTKVWVSLKTVFFPIILIELFWFVRRLNLLTRSPNLLEKMMIGLGLAVSFLNLPMEYLTLSFDMPWLNLFNDIKQGVFYATLLTFWLIFAGEHQMNESGPGESGLMDYWKNLSVVLFGCLCLFVFDMCERGVQLQNPFFSIWVTELGTNLALGFIILAGISAGLYFIFLCYMIYKVLRTISNRSTDFNSMSRLRRLHYQGIVWRFKFLMLATLLTAALTVIGFIIGQVAEGAVTGGAYGFDDDYLGLEYTSGFMTGVYGMWNIYIFGLLFLYAPSHKNWGDDDTASTGEEVEFDLGVTAASTEPASEMSRLTDFREFVRHQATD